MAEEERQVLSARLVQLTQMKMEKEFDLIKAKYSERQEGLGTFIAEIGELQIELDCIDQQSKDITGRLELMSAAISGPWRAAGRHSGRPRAPRGPPGPPLWR